jgi:NAD(P)-dependent dehydrogenase (short-subunit alcohol dehydrogenase family)
MSLLHDKVVLVSGGTQGVGAGIVKAGAGEGATVAFTGRRPNAGDKLADELVSAGATAAFIQTDLADPQQAINSVRQTVDRFGRIDCLVNSAGLTTRGSLLDTSVELFEQHMAINLRAPWVTGQRVRSVWATGSVVGAPVHADYGDVDSALAVLVLSLELPPR